jgi:hypothetical protein
MTEHRTIEPDGRREIDKERVLLLRVMAAALVLCALGTVVCVVISFTALKNHVSIQDIESTQAQIRRESNARVDQRCRADEQAQIEAVRKLKRNYEYLAGLTPAERKESVNRAILRLLPDTEKEARISRAPRYCDAPGVGLPEPNPGVPKRPPSLG